MKSDFSRSQGRSRSQIGYLVTTESHQGQRYSISYISLVTRFFMVKEIKTCTAHIPFAVGLLKYLWTSKGEKLSQMNILREMLVWLK